MKPQRARDDAMRANAKRRLCAGAARDHASVWLDSHCQREAAEVSVGGSAGCGSGSQESMAQKAIAATRNGLIMSDMHIACAVVDTRDSFRNPN